MDDSPYIYWDTGPVITEIGPFTLRWYGLLFAGAFLIGFVIVRQMFREEKIPEQNLDPLLFYMIIGTIVGARLGHCLFYDPGYYLSHPIEIFKIWRGGLASHGGVIGIFIGLYLYARKRPDQSYFWLLDRIAVPAALGASLIRLGNLFNSEIFGVPTEVPWAFIFARVDTLPRHPAQLYESVGYGLIFIVLLLVYRKYRARTPRGLLLGLLLVLVFTHRFLVEFVKVHQAAFGGDWPLSVGQILSIPLIFIGIGLLVNVRRVGRQKPVR